MAERAERLKGYLARDPGNWNLRAELFDVALAEGDRDVARAELERALRERPGDAGWLHREAALLLASRDWPQAQLALEHLLARGVDDPAVHHDLAYALFAQGQVEAARDAVAPWIEVPGEGGAAALVLWLRCEHRLDRIDEGLDAFRSLQARLPVAPEAFGVASLMAIDAGQWEEARTWSDRALAGRPDQMEALAARGTLLLGGKDAAGAIAWFERALRVNPGDGRCWSGLAFGRMLGLDLRGAMQAFRRALDAMPEHVGTWIGLGWCQVLTQEPGAARETFERAVERDRGFAESHGGLAVALARLGEDAAARHEIGVALRLDRMCLSARYAEAVLAGEADDPQAFLRLARRVLEKHPVGKGLTGLSAPPIQ